MAPAAAAAAAASSRRAQWTRLLHAALEAWVHQVLFQRRVYPPESFVPARCGGVACRRNRHPGVLTYVRRSVAAAVESLAPGDIGTVRFTLMIVLDAAVTVAAAETASAARGNDNMDDDRDDTVARELERYEIDVSLIDSPEWARDATDVDAEAFARALRGLLLQVLSQVPDGAVAEAESLSFRLAHRSTRDIAASRAAEGDGGSTADAVGAATHRPAAARVERFLWDDFGSGLYTLRFTMAQGKPS